MYMALFLNRRIHDGHLQYSQYTCSAISFGVDLSFVYELCSPPPASRAKLGEGNKVRGLRSGKLCLESAACEEMLVP